jgi:hypothetical protein
LGPSEPSIPAVTQFKVMPIKGDLEYPANQSVCVQIAIKVVLMK